MRGKDRRRTLIDARIQSSTVHSSFLLRPTECRRYSFSRAFLARYLFSSPQTPSPTPTAGQSPIWATSIFSCSSLCTASSWASYSFSATATQTTNSDFPGTIYDKKWWRNYHGVVVKSDLFLEFFISDITTCQCHVVIKCWPCPLVLDSARGTLVIGKWRVTLVVGRETVLFLFYVVALRDREGVAVREKSTWGATYNWRTVVKHFYLNNIYKN